MNMGLLIDYKWCVGCHTCEIACQQAHEGYPPTKIGEQGKFGIKILEIGPHDLGNNKFQYEFIPVPTSLCDECAERTAKGKIPTCAKHCETGCITYGPIDELAQKMDSGHMALFSY